MREVYVAGVGMTRFAKQPGRTLKDLTAEAVGAALKDAGQTIEDVQSCYFGNAVAGSMTGQEMLAGQFALRPLGLGGIPVFNVENACASASTAFHLAWQAVAPGVHDAVLAVGAEKMTHPDKTRSFAAIGGSVDVETAPADLPAGRSFLMDMYAGSALRYMERTGASLRSSRSWRRERLSGRSPCRCARRSPTAQPRPCWSAGTCARPGPRSRYSRRRRGQPPSTG